jgi:hypothetical protein
MAATAPTRADPSGLNNRIDNHEFLLRKLLGSCCDRIGQQKSDGNNEIKRLRSGRVANIGKVIRSAGTLNSHHLQTKICSGLIGTLEAHIIEGKITPSPDITDDGHLTFERSLGHSRCHQQSDHQHRCRKDGNDQLWTVFHF